MAWGAPGGVQAQRTSGPGCGAQALIGCGAVVVGFFVLAIVAALIGEAALSGGPSITQPSGVQSTVRPPTPTLTPTSEPTPSASKKPSRKPTKKATKKPTKKATKKPTYQPKGSSVLWANGMYKGEPRGRCTSTRSPRGWADYQRIVRRLVACQNALWKPYLRKRGFSFTPVRTRFYSTSVTSPCGRSDGQFPAFYCPSNSTMYFSRASSKQGAYNRHNTARVVFHEYAHHVQRVVGVLHASYVSPEKRDVVNRRVELQAYCVEFYGITHNRIRVNGDDMAYFRETWYNWAPDPRGHGSKKANGRWGPRGYRATSLGTCNTFRVPPSQVK